LIYLIKSGDFFWYNEKKKAKTQEKQKKQEK